MRQYNKLLELLRQKHRQEIRLLLLVSIAKDAEITDICERSDV